MPPCGFISEVIVRFVLLDMSAECSASLHPRIRGIARCAEGVDGLEFAIAEVSVDIAVEVVRSGAGNNVNNAAGGAAIFGGVTVGDDLEFLHRFLRHGGADALDD